MLQRRSHVFRSALLLGDVLVVASAWLLAHLVALRFGLDVGESSFGSHLVALAGIAPAWIWVFRQYGLYTPRRLDSPFRDLISVVGAGSLVTLLLIAFAYLARSDVVTRAAVVPFWMLGVAGSALVHVGGRKLVRVIHRGGRYLQPVLVVGSGDLASEVIERIRDHPEAGLRVAGVLSDDLEVKRVAGIPVLGSIDRLKVILQLSGATEVILALSHNEGHRAEDVLARLEDELVDVRMVPDLLQIFTLRASVEDLDGLPVIALRQSPLFGWAALQKRVFDIVVSVTLLAAAFPAMAAIGVAIAVTQGRPVFFRQSRVGLDGRVFRILKFRTMVDDAERETGPVWASADDHRQTKLGRILRRWSLDELPQIWNVLRGDMSLVGPRPERPVFIERFRREVPGYMLRHKVKAGLTGWAQVHRWRGDTSLHERIEHDLYYIQNWSFSLDLRILLMTLWRSRIP